MLICQALSFRLKKPPENKGRNTGKAFEEFQCKRYYSSFTIFEAGYHAGMKKWIKTKMNGNKVTGEKKLKVIMKYQST